MGYRRIVPSSATQGPTTTRGRGRTRQPYAAPPDQWSLTRSTQGVESWGEYANDVLLDSPLALLRMVDNGEYTGTGTIPNLGTARIFASHNIDQGGKYASATLIPRCGDDTRGYDFVRADNQYVWFEDASTWDFTTQLTVEAWIRPDTLPGFGSDAGIICKPGTYELKIDNNGYLVGSVADAFSTSVTGSTALQSGTTYHVAMTFNSSGNKLVVYVNGAEDGSATSSGSLTANGQRLWFGTQNDGSGRHFDGVIQWPAVYGTALTTQQIRRHYMLGAKKNRLEANMQSAESSATVLWEFDSNVASITRVSGGYHGTYAFRATADADGGQMSIRHYNGTTRDTYERCLAGRTYSARLRLKNGSSRNAYIQIAYWDSGFSGLGTSGASLPLTTTGGWDLHSLDVGLGQDVDPHRASPANAFYAGIIIIVPGAAGSETVDFDAIELYDGMLPSTPDLPPATSSLAATATATASGSAAVSTVKSLAASATATASGSAAVSRVVSLAASSTATTSGSAAVSRIASLAASDTATASGSAAASGVKPLAATGTATGGATADTSRTATLAATGTATGGSTAAVSRTATLAASATATASGSAAVTRVASLAATGSATGSAAADISVTVAAISLAASATATASGSAGIDRKSVV